MLIELANWLERYFTPLHLFQYITFRALMATLTALLLSLCFGPRLIDKLAALKAGQVVRTDGPQTHLVKAGTPTMGGVMILLAVTLATLLWTDLSNRYVWLVLAVLLGFGVIGFYDDYSKLVLKDPRGLVSRWKYCWQSVLGLTVAVLLYKGASLPAETALYVPVFKHVALPLGVWFVVLAYFMIVGFSNAVNLTDGLDGLASGCSLTTLLALIVIALTTVAGDTMGYQLAVLDPLQRPVPQRQREMVEAAVQLSALGGSLLAFLWFNSFPARVFMGDTGSLPIGGLLAFNALMIRCELLLAVAGGVFVAETLSVILQVAWFKRTRRRLLLCSPLHNHFVFRGDHEQKIVVRFWIASTVLSILAVTAHAIVT